jgi:hypothetical protein
MARLSPGALTPHRGNSSLLALDHTARRYGQSLLATPRGVQRQPLAGPFPQPEQQCEERQGESPWAHVGANESLPKKSPHRGGKQPAAGAALPLRVQTPESQQP